MIVYPLDAKRYGLPVIAALVACFYLPRPTWAQTGRPQAPRQICVDNICASVPKEGSGHPQDPAPVPPAADPASDRKPSELESAVKALGFFGRVERSEFIDTSFARELLSIPGEKGSHVATILGTRYKRLDREKYLGVPTAYYESDNHQPLVLGQTAEGRIVGSGSTAEGPLEIWPDPREGAAAQSGIAMWFHAADIARPKGIEARGEGQGPKRAPVQGGSVAKECPERVGKSDGTLTLYIAVTRAAKEEADAQHVGPEVMIANQLVEFNEAFWCAGANIRVAAPDRADYSDFLESEDQSDRALIAMVNRLTDSSDPASETFRKRRAAARGDIGVLVIHRKSKDQCGQSSGVGVDAKHAVLVVNWQCIADQIPILHEIGHILGARHAEDDPSFRPSYARAFMWEDGKSSFETAVGLRQDAQGHFVPRRAYFSNPSQKLGDVVIGIPNEADNAQIVRRAVWDAIRFHELL